MSASIAVIIATKDRSQEIERHALASLERSEHRGFVCVVWDASRDDATQRIVEGGSWSFPLAYLKAPRIGSSSQRNDAVEHVLEHHPTVSYVLFIDDDCELSPDALGGILATFQATSASLVGLPMYPRPGERIERGGLAAWSKRALGWDRHGATEFLYNYGSLDEERGAEMEWASGGGMAVDMDIFRGGLCFFPEAFQRFGGYALGEDFAFSCYLHKKLGKRIINSLYGHFLHHPAPGGRPDVAGMAASKWHNFHLLFEAIYEDVHGPRRLWLRAKFEIFLCAAALKVLVRARSWDLLSVLRGVRAARRALKEHRRGNDIQTLFQRTAAQGDDRR